MGNFSDCECVCVHVWASVGITLTHTRIYTSCVRVAKRRGAASRFPCWPHMCVYQTMLMNRLTGANTNKSAPRLCAPLRERSSSGESYIIFHKSHKHPGWLEGGAEWGRRAFGSQFTLRGRRAQAAHLQAAYFQSIRKINTRRVSARAIAGMVCVCVCSVLRMCLRGTTERTHARHQRMTEQVGKG